MESFVKVDQKHGLWHFFREFYSEDKKMWQRTTVEFKDQDGYSGRSWSAAELRRKSFKDLHTLWYVLLRERNLLATQKEEARRLGVPSIAQQTDISWKAHQCKKSMARIKCVINERRLAYEGAVERFTQDKALGKLGATAEREAASLKASEQRTTRKGKGRNIDRRRRRVRGQ
jgi:large subunit ribosomal protein L47